ncbi:hypothetical protein E1176_12365, partial [Fulvivirga sp. RKSG066]|uniref:imm11 family protein n=1 Tax=Fulvivirga aurantia TaxID=2529383 RepID=UPI001CA3DF4C
MNYYEVHRESDMKISGSLSQIDEAVRLLPRKERSVYLTLNRREWPDPMPDLDIFKLHKNAKLTDVLSSTFTSGAVGLVVNQKVKDIINRCEVESTKVFPTRIFSYDEQNEYNYFLFYILESRDVVDFPNSQYYRTNYLGDKRYKKVNPKSVEEFYELYSNGDEGIVSPATIKLFKTPDLFRLPWGVSPLISENLKNQLEE